MSRHGGFKRIFYGDGDRLFNFVAELKILIQRLFSAILPLILKDIHFDRGVAGSPSVESMTSHLPKYKRIYGNESFSFFKG